MGKSVGSIAGAVSGGLSPAGIFGAIGGAKIGDKIGQVTGLNGITDAFDDVSDSSSISRVGLRSFDDLKRGRSELEESASESQQAQFDQLNALLGRGGQAQVEGDIDAARSEQLNLAQLLRQAQSGPSSQNINAAQNFASAIFNPQEVALQQQFQQGETETSRLAARLGRQVDDPILRAKLAEGQARQSAQLQAQKGAFTAQQAQGFQQQGINLQSQLAQVRGGLASQALQNRQALLGLGQSLVNQERQFRLNTANRTGNQQVVNQGGIGDVLGAVGGIAGTVGKFAGLG